MQRDAQCWVGVGTLVLWLLPFHLLCFIYCALFLPGLRRKVLYQRAPRNIHRHVILSEIKEAVAALPPDVTTQSVMGFDPLPPSDTIYSYVRPERLSPVSHGNTIALFFRSLLPNYTVEGERPEEGVAGGLNRNQGLNRLMLAVRDMMANFHLNDLEAPHEDDADGEGEWD
ncbi:transcription factor 25-like isoform X1 [Papio anubis]|uniref:transcription factor 25-like isoform X1 n=1 Tax=Papio anubis TaxID=9555 RepID=UPI0012AE9D68|nr:transcription factor 25-like isoform X1 [Papio anubis]XP_031513867.1 transcription factor 25-like isoform X1 [Papio anubis]